MAQIVATNVTLGDKPDFGIMPTADEDRVAFFIQAEGRRLALVLDPSEEIDSVAIALIRVGERVVSKMKAHGEQRVIVTAPPNGRS